MTRKHWFLLLAGLVVGLIISGRYALLAQDRAEPPQANSRPAPPEKSGELPNGNRGSRRCRTNVSRVAFASRMPRARSPLQEALLRPYRFPFSRPTSLEQVCAHLRETLKGAVVLDLAALDRKSVEPKTTVQLELEGVRLKTGFEALARPGGPDLSRRRRRQLDDHHRPGGLRGSRRPDLGRAARSSSRPARRAGRRRRSRRLPGSGRRGRAPRAQADHH